MKEMKMRETFSPHPLRVLVVDDRKDNRDSLAMLLQMWGHEVHQAHDGPSALEAAQTFHPDAVLLDIGLPGMSGWEVGRLLRQQPDSPGLLLVALSGHGLEQDRASSCQAGFDAHLTKPADLVELQRLLATAPRILALADAG
jgi:CheY-like chemotaxis protein